MKRSWILLLFLIFFGCVQTVTIIVEPKEAKIFVDGEYLGEGNASFEAGLAYDIPKTHTIQLTHKDFETFQTEIKNKLDVGVASLFAGLMIAIGLLDILWWAETSEPRALGDAQLYLGIGTIAISPIYYLISYKFKDVYSYDLTN